MFSFSICHFGQRNKPFRQVLSNFRSFVGQNNSKEYVICFIKELEICFVKGSTSSNAVVYIGNEITSNGIH